MDGHLSAKFEQWRSVLLKCLAHTEAVIDFGDDDREDDIGTYVYVCMCVCACVCVCIYVYV